MLPRPVSLKLTDVSEVLSATIVIMESETSLSFYETTRRNIRSRRGVFNITMERHSSPLLPYPIINSLDIKAVVGICGNISGCLDKK
jgi:hypothetical protein